MRRNDIMLGLLVGKIKKRPTNSVAGGGITAADAYAAAMEIPKHRWGGLSPSGERWLAAML